MRYVLIYKNYQKKSTIKQLTVNPILVKPGKISLLRLKDLYRVQQLSPCDIATSFLQHHFCNVILIRRIILICRFGQNHRHRPHSCPCRQQKLKTLTKWHTDWKCESFASITIYHCMESSLFTRARLSYYTRNMRCRWYIAALEGLD